ncbi:hypothetical protein HER14_12450 [Acidithiobacillus thiooxidans]|uniref:hypothetical protein n=1 Tax=Acidithiobacillus thiooxidans TaxID=930 RepID=UPI001C06DD66|nr:hypothetical protein [Acidithiobacillus thiooxidans]MBU2751720.1 hypothetical protein [Acidithiobacillus thiooxidans]
MESSEELEEKEPRVAVEPAGKLAIRALQADEAEEKPPEEELAQSHELGLRIEEAKEKEEKKRRKSSGRAQSERPRPSPLACVNLWARLSE